MIFFIADGKILERKEFQLPEDFFDTRLRLSQKIWYGYGGIPLFSENLTLLRRQADAAGIPFPAEFAHNRELFRLVKRMLNKNRFYRSGVLHLQLFAGTSSIHTLVTCSASTGFTWAFAEEGLLVSYSGQKKFTANTMNRLPWFNEQLWLAALAETKKTACNNAIILNDKDGVCECPFSSLFIIQENYLITPSFESGCHENPLRQLIMEGAENLGLSVKEAAFIPAKELTEADEIFCTSEEYGMQWLMGIGQQRFLRYYSEKINEEINSLLKKKAVLSPL